jgi:hypothetical protein
MATPPSVLWLKYCVSAAEQDTIDDFAMESIPELLLITRRYDNQSVLESCCKLK